MNGSDNQRYRISHLKASKPEIDMSIWFHWKIPQNIQTMSTNSTEPLLNMRRQHFSTVYELGFPLTPKPDKNSPKRRKPATNMLKKAKPTISIQRAQENHGEGSPVGGRAALPESKAGSLSSADITASHGTTMTRQTGRSRDSRTERGHGPHLGSRGGVLTWARAPRPPARDRSGRPGRLRRGAPPAHGPLPRQPGAAAPGSSAPTPRHPHACTPARRRTQVAVRP